MSKIVYRGKKSTTSAESAEAEELKQTPAEEQSAAQEAKTENTEQDTKSSAATETAAVTEEQPKREAAEASTQKSIKKTVKAKAVKPKKTEAEPVVDSESTLETAAADETDARKEAAATATVAEIGEDESVTIEEESASDADVSDGDNSETTETFDKAKIIKYFKRHPKMTINTKVERFNPDLKSGLSPEQVETRFKQFLFNDTNKKYSKSIASIFIGNICTFFNLLCLIAFIALLLAGMQNFTNYLVIVITAANIFIGIFQEIRAKIAIDKLSIMATSSTKVLRDGEVLEIPTAAIVLDDLVIM